MESGSWGGVQTLSLELPFPLRAPGTETRGAPCAREGSARLPTWRLGNTGVTWPCRWKDAAAADPDSPSGGRSASQIGMGAAGALWGGPLSLRSAPGVRRVRSLPEARGWRAGLAPHCGSGCGAGWARRGRVSGASAHSHPRPRFFPPPIARCHLFAACHVFRIPCQAGWLVFGGRSGDFI